MVRPTPPPTRHPCPTATCTCPHVGELPLMFAGFQSSARVGSRSCMPRTPQHQARRTCAGSMGGASRPAPSAAAQGRRARRPSRSPWWPRARRRGGSAARRLRPSSRAAPLVGEGRFGGGSSPAARTRQPRSRSGWSRHHLGHPHDQGGCSKSLPRGVTAPRRQLHLRTACPAGWGVVLA